MVLYQEFDVDLHGRAVSFREGSGKGLLVGGWTNLFEKYARQIGSFPQVRVKIKNVWNHHLV